MVKSILKPWLNNHTLTRLSRHPLPSWMILSTPLKDRSRKLSKMGRGTWSCLKSQSLLRIFKHRMTSSRTSLWTTKNMSLTREAPQHYRTTKSEMNKRMQLPTWDQKEVQTGNATKWQCRIKVRKNERRMKSRRLVSSKTSYVMT